jgi:hypothetical protein
MENAVMAHRPLKFDDPEEDLEKPDWSWGSQPVSPGLRILSFILAAAIAFPVATVATYLIAASFRP